MGNVVRIFRYARQHADKAEIQLSELETLQKKLHDWSVRTDSMYTDALANGDTYVPISFMRGYKEYNRYRTRVEDMENLIVMNLSLSLSFCAELVCSMIHDPESEALGYKLRIRIIVDKIIKIATSEALDRASLAPLSPAIAKIESEIALNEFSVLRLMKNHLMEFRAKIS